MPEYKFEQSNKQIIQSYHSYSGDRDQAETEIDEVYDKAKAFDRIKVFFRNCSNGDAKCIKMINYELESE